MDGGLYFPTFQSRNGRLLRQFVFVGMYRKEGNGMGQDANIRDKSG